MSIAWDAASHGARYLYHTEHSPKLEGASLCNPLYLKCPFRKEEPLVTCCPDPALDFKATTGELFVSNLVAGIWRLQVISIRER